MHHHSPSRLTAATSSPRHGTRAMLRMAALATALTLAGCASTTVDTSPALYAYSTIDALLSGTYDGELTMAQLATKGDIGLGTFNQLDGEMLLLGGVPYHFRADGSVTVASPADKTPLAYVMPFKPTMQFGMEDSAAAPLPATLPAIEAWMDARLVNKNVFYAVELKGEFKGMATRAIAAQARPYKPLAELVKTQIVFPRASVTGSMVGIRSPAFSKGVSVPGWHWHFISNDRTYGGHVLAAGLVSGVARVASAHRVELQLPANDDFAKSDQTKDRTLELHSVERQQHQ